MVNTNDGWLHCFPTWQFWCYHKTDCDWQRIWSWGSRASAALGQPTVPAAPAAPWIWKAKHLYCCRFRFFFFFLLLLVAQPPRLFGALSYWILTWGNAAATFQPFSDGGIRALTPEDYSRCFVSTSLCAVVLRVLRVSPPTFEESTRQHRFVLFYFLRFAAAENDGVLLPGAAFCHSCHTSSVRLSFPIILSPRSFIIIISF